MEIRAFSAHDGTKLFYGIDGPPDGVAVVLCHGLAANGRQFEADARYFAELGYRVIVPDIRGHGRSSFPADYRRTGFSTAVLAQDMLALLDNAGVAGVHWVGNSLGGIIALEMIAAAPERFESLSLFGTAFRLKLPRITGPIFPLLYRVMGRGWLSELTAASTTRERSDRKLIAEMIADFDPRVGQAITGHVRRYDLTANALGWTGPMLIMVGGMDRAVNLVLKPALKRIGARDNWTVAHLPDGGHCANLDATEQFRNELRAFWGKA